MTDVEVLLRRHLTAVEPAESLRRRLRADLQAAHPNAKDSARPAATTSSWLWLFAGLGGVLSLGSLAVVAVRRGPGWVARLAPRRDVTPA